MNVLLDLVNGGVLALWLGAGFQNCTTYLVWQEIIVTTQKEHIQSFVEAGLLRLEDVPPEWWSEASELSRKLGIAYPTAQFGF